MSVPNFKDSYGQSIEGGDIMVVNFGKNYSRMHLAVLGNILKRKTYNATFHYLSAGGSELYEDKNQYGSETFDNTIKANGLQVIHPQFQLLLQKSLELKGQDFYKVYTPGYQHPFFIKWMRSLRKLNLQDRYRHWSGNKKAEYSGNFTTTHNDEKYRTDVIFYKGGNYKISVGSNWYRKDARHSSRQSDCSNPNYKVDGGVEIFKEQEFLDWLVEKQDWVKKQ